MNDDRQMSLADFSAEEREAVMSIAALVFRQGDMAFFQLEKGLISLERLDSILGPVKSTACNRIYQEVWSGLGENFVQEYQDYVEGLIASC
jgi:hypothetical protein